MAKDSTKKVKAPRLPELLRDPHLHHDTLRAISEVVDDLQYRGVEGNDVAEPLTVQRALVFRDACDQQITVGLGSVVPVPSDMIPRGGAALDV